MNLITFKNKVAGMLIDKLNERTNKKTPCGMFAYILTGHFGQPLEIPIPPFMAENPIIMGVALKTLAVQMKIKHMALCAEAQALQIGNREDIRELLGESLDETKENLSNLLSREGIREKFQRIVVMNVTSVETEECINARYKLDEAGELDLTHETTAELSSLDTKEGILGNMPRILEPEMAKFY